MANVMLVHGAWCDGSSWSRVIPTLQREGHRVVAVQIPLTSLADDIEVARRTIARFDGPVTLVGHSYGGAVISGAGENNGQVAGLIFVAAYAPDEGETVLSLGQRVSPTDGGAAIRATDDGWLTIDVDLFPQVFAADVDTTDAAVLAAVQKPTHGLCFGSPAGPAAWRTLPTAYVRSAHDRMINPDLQTWMADRMQARVTTVEASHASPVARGDEVAGVINDVLAASA